MRFVTTTMLVALLSLAGRAKDLEIKAGDGTGYVFHAPENAQVFKNNPPAGIPPSIKVRSASNRMSLQITFMPKGKRDYDNQAALNELVGKMGARQYEGGSVERKTEVVALKVNGGLGAIARYTDAELANVANPRPGQFKVVAAGAIVLGKNLATVTLLGDSFDSEDYKQGLSLLESGFTPKPADSLPQPPEF